MRNTPVIRIRPTAVIALTSVTSVLLLLAILLFPIVTAVTAAGYTSAVAAAANRQPLPTIPPEVGPPAVEVEGEAGQPPFPTLPPEVGPPAVEAEASHPSPRIIPSAPPTIVETPTPGPSVSASDQSVFASPTPELPPPSDPSPGPAIFPPGSITVRLWTCRPGYSPFTSGANLIADCLTPSDREIFGLTVPGQSGTWDDRTSLGLLTFDGLGPATYTLSHSPPALTAYSIPLGCTTPTGIATATPPANALAGPPMVSLVSISLPLAQNQAIVCDWYDVPSRRSAFPPVSNPSTGPVERAP